MFKNSINLEVLNEEKVKTILDKDEAAAKKAGKSSFWKKFNDGLENVIKDKEFRENVFLHAVKSLQYATQAQALTEATTSSAVATYNKAMLPTIITRVFPQIVATKFIATRQLDVPTQVIQTFRLAKANSKPLNSTAGQEFFDPSLYYTEGAAPKQYQLSNKVLDPYYSSSLTIELGSSNNTAGVVVTAFTKPLTYTPVIPGFVTIYQGPIANINDQMTWVSYATDDGNGNIVLTGTSTVVGTINYATGIITDTGGDSLPAYYQWVTKYYYNMERNSQLSELTFKQSLIQVSAKARKNFAQISAEALQDLSAYSEGKLDGLKELVNGMTESMALEIDNELLLAMMSKAGKFSTWDALYPSGQFRGTQFQRNQELVHKMNYLANDMSIDFLRGEGMFAITHPHIYTVLQNTNEFRMVDNDHKPQGTFDVGTERFGMINNFTVGKAPQFPYSDRMLMGFTSKDLGKAPYAYFPFVTYLTPPMPDIKGQDMFSTIIGLQQRYDHQLLLDGSHGLGVLNVQNLYVVGQGDEGLN
jgi:hypothetical protein